MLPILGKQRGVADFLPDSSELVNFDSKVDLKAGLYLISRTQCIRVQIGPGKAQRQMVGTTCPFD
jgi:hypothetical protein